MKISKRAYQVVDLNSANRISTRDSNPIRIRKILGLPDLKDTDRNCVSMHNARIENEVHFINKRMGSTQKSSYDKASAPAKYAGIDSRFGF